MHIIDRKGIHPPNDTTSIPISNNSAVVASKVHYHSLDFLSDVSSSRVRNLILESISTSTNEKGDDADANEDANNDGNEDANNDANEDANDDANEDANEDANDDANKNANDDANEDAKDDDVNAEEIVVRRLHQAKIVALVVELKYYLHDSVIKYIISNHLYGIT